MFQFKVGSTDCDLLRAAISRYYKIVFYTGSDSTTLRFHPHLRSIHVKDVPVLPALVIMITGACETWPSLGMDESCESTNLPAAGNLTNTLTSPQRPA